MKIKELIRQIGLFYICFFSFFCTIMVIKGIALDISIPFMLMNYILLSVYIFFEWKKYTYKRDWYLKYVSKFNLLKTYKTQRYQKQLAGDLKEVENLTLYFKELSNSVLRTEYIIEKNEILINTKFYNHFKDMKDEHRQMRDSII